MPRYPGRGWSCFSIKIRMYDEKVSVGLLPVAVPCRVCCHPHWEYSGEAGPGHWAKLTPEFGQCAGSNQSPVDLSGLVEAKLAPLVLHYQAGGNTVVNNGHTVQVGYAPGSTLQLDGTTFELKQFHFHAPSENLIEGKSYPLEGHLVHVSDKGDRSGGGDVRGWQGQSGTDGSLG